MHWRRPTTDKSRLDKEDGERIACDYVTACDATSRVLMSCWHENLLAFADITAAGYDIAVTVIYLI